jgi:hypothetical protein
MVFDIFEVPPPQRVFRDTGRLGRKFPLLSSCLARGQARLKRASMSQAAPTTKIEMTAEIANTRPAVDQISSLKPA